MFTLPTTITSKKPLLLEELNNLPADAAAQTACSILTGTGVRRDNHAGFNLLGDQSIGKSMMLAVTTQADAA